MALSFAAFINPTGGPETIEAYRKMFKPSPQLAAPQVSVGIFVFCGDTEEKAQQMQAVMDYRLLSISKGKADESPSYESVRTYNYSPDEWKHVLFNRQRMIVGTPDFVKEKLDMLALSYKADEIVVATFADTFEDRVRSYELVAEMASAEKTG
jgi:alkanesulfonate monooxygenase SsuD/methylene tetrahydromethanopterin reductase-like flavin-dependent oxidoreductase (luciferase family)